MFLSLRTPGHWSNTFQELCQELKRNSQELSGGTRVERPRNLTELNVLKSELSGTPGTIWGTKTNSFWNRNSEEL